MTSNKKILSIIFAISITIILNITAIAQSPIMPINPEIDRNLRTAHSLIRIGKFQNAILILDRLKNQYGEDARILSMYKNLYIEAKMYPELESIIRIQLSKAPQNPIVIAELGNALFLQDDPNTADSLWDRALSISGANQAVYLFVANYNLRYGDYEKAIETYLDGRKKLELPRAFTNELANIYESQQNYPAAVAEYIVDLDDNTGSIARASIKIRGILDNVENYEEIIDEVKKGLKETDKAPSLHEIIGELYIKIGRMDEALESFKTAGKLKSDDGESLYRFAYRCFEFKEFLTATIAVDEYLDYSKEKRRKDNAYLLKAKAEIETEQFDTALATLSLIQTSANDIRIVDEASYLAGLIFSEHKNDCDSAVIYWEEALNSIKRDEFIRKINVEIGLCNIKADNLQKAEVYLMKSATRAKPDNNFDEAMFLLGDIHLFQGNYKKASEFYTSLIKSKPSGDYTNNAIERLSIISTVGIDDSGMLADNSVLANFSQAIKAWTIGEFEDAATRMQDPILSGSQVAEQSLFYAGQIYLDAGNHVKSKERFRDYIESYPDGLFTDRSLLELGDIYRKIDNDPLTAVENYNKILELFPNSVVIEAARERLREIEALNKVG